MISGLAIDIYPGDRRLDCDAFVAAGPPWCCVIAKASQGTRYRYDAWLRDLLARYRAAAGDRYGVDLFDGCYAFLDLAAPGAPQIDYALNVIAMAGGDEHSMLPLMLDIERGGQLHPDAISLAQVEDVVRPAAERYHELTGRLVTLYGGELLRSVGVTDRLGCGRSAVALYGPRLGRTFREHGAVREESTAEFLAATGTDLEHLEWWQYAAAEGAPTKPPPGYPSVAPGIGRVDISALTLSGGLDGLRATLWPAV